MDKMLSKEDRDIVTGNDWIKKDFYDYRKSQVKKKNKLLVWVAVIAIMSIITLKCHSTEYECVEIQTGNSLAKTYKDSGSANIEAVRRKVKKRYSSDNNQYLLFLRQYMFFKSSVEMPKNKVSAAIKLRNDCITLFYTSDNDFFKEIDVYLLKAIEDYGVCEKYEK